MCIYFSKITHNGETVDTDGGGTVAIDINQVSESALAHEGTIIFTNEDGTQSKLFIPEINIFMFSWF